MCRIYFKGAPGRLCNFSGEKHEHHQGFFFGGVFRRRQLAKPPSGREVDRDSGGRSLRDFGVLISFIVTRSPSVAFGASSLPEGAFVRHPSADSGFGLLPDGAWTAMRYACPRRERRESRKCSLIYLYFYAIISLKIKAILYFSSTNTSWNNF